MDPQIIVRDPAKGYRVSERPPAALFGRATALFRIGLRKRASASS
jgi:hypothetical protein